MKVTETRKIDSSKVRALCIERDFYTCGTNSEYEHLLLTLCDNQKKMNTTAIIEIALDIYSHSNREKLNYTYGDKKTALESIIFCLINDCCYTFIEVKE